MTFTQLLTSLNARSPFFVATVKDGNVVNANTDMVVKFGDRGGTIVFDGISFGFDFGSDTAQCFIEGQWVALRDERQLNKILESRGEK